MHLPKTLLLTILAATSLVSELRAQSSYQFFLNLDGISGESVGQNHVGDIEVISFKAGVIQKLIANFAGGGARGSTSEFKPVTVFKFLDSTTPKLFLACATGQHIKKAILSVSRPPSGEENPGFRDFFQIILSDVVVASASEDSDTQDGEGALVESISLSYTKIEWVYTPQKQDGTAGTPIRGSYDVKANKRL